MADQFRNTSIGNDNKITAVGAATHDAILQSTSFIKFAIFFIILGLISTKASQAQQLGLTGPGTTLNQSIPVTAIPESSEQGLTQNEKIGLASIISKIGISTTKSARDALISDFLDEVIDRRGLQKYISNRGDLALRISNKLDNHLSKAPKGATFGADLIGAVFVDFVADELMDRIASSHDGSVGGKVLAYTAAATANVMIKEVYIYATSGGNQIKVLVGQASLLVDIAIKDIEALNEAIDAHQVAELASMRADMHEAYAEFYGDYLSATTDGERSSIVSQFEDRLQEIGQDYDISYSHYLGDHPLITSANPFGPGNLDIDGQRYNDPLPDTFADPRDTLTEEFDELAELFVQTLETSAPDIQDDLVQDIIEDAEPEPEPRVTLRGVLTATGDDGITTGYTTSNAGIAGPISSGSTLLRYYGFQGAESDDPDAYYDVASAGSATRPSGYSHLYWGRWRGTSYEPGGPGGCGQNGYCGITEYDGAYWLVGIPTTRSEFSLRSGSAYFDGRIRGDYDTGSSIQRDAISGNVAFEVGFSTGDVTGRFDLNRNGTAWNTLRFSGSIYERNGDTGITGDLVNVGENGQGWASGLFYGADASEVGGSFHFEDYGSGAATGIFYAHDGASGFDIPLTQVAFHTGTYQYNWDTGSYEVETSTSHSARVDSSAINDFRDGYEYTSWGTWGVDPNTGLTTGLASIEALETDSNWRNGAWVAGQTTPINDRPRSGTATYNGGAIGVSTFGDVVSGGIHMEADFARDRITADMDLYTTNGDAWVSASGSGRISDNTANDTVTFSGNGDVTSGPGTFGFNGAFNGPNAAEASGAWVIDGTGDSAMPGAAGIFRANQ